MNIRIQHALMRIHPSLLKPIIWLQCIYCVTLSDSLIRARVLHFKIIEVKSETNLLPYFNFDPTPGEYWVLSYCMANRDFYCVIDEEKSRNLAFHLRFNLIGTIGLLEILRDQGFYRNIDLQTQKKLYWMEIFGCHRNYVKD